MEQDILLSYDGGTRLYGGDFALTMTDQDRLIRELNIILQSEIGGNIFRGVSLHRFIGIPISNKLLSLMSSDIKNYINELLSTKSYNFDVKIQIVGPQKVELSLEEITGSKDKISLSTFNIGTGDIEQPVDPFDLKEEVQVEVGKYREITNKYIKRNKNFGIEE